MENDKLTDIIKEIGTDVRLLADYFSKLCVFIAVNSECNQANIEFETTPTRDYKVFAGKFQFKVKED
jgi:hypothetical protein